MLVLIAPAYNEELSIVDFIDEWMHILEKIKEDFKLIIIDDGSKDKTYEFARSQEKKYANLQVLTKKNSGHGSTLLFGYRKAIELGADWIFQTDSDRQTNPKEFLDFWALRNESPFVIGIRNKRKDGFSRIIVTKVLWFVLVCIFKRSVKDANTPFRLIKSNILKEYLEIIPEHFFLSNVLISSIAVCRKEIIQWIPITFLQRQKGTNSINIPRIFGIGKRALGELAKFRKENKKFIYRKL